MMRFVELSVGVVVSMAMIVGCGGGEPVSKGAQALGIASFDVHETNVELQINGRSERGEVMGQLLVQRGRFIMADDDRGEVDGRRLSVLVRGWSASHESEGYRPLTLPLLVGGQSSAIIDAFLLDRNVSAPLASWGIAFDPESAKTPLTGAVTDRPAGVPVTSGERPYSPCNGGSGCLVSGNSNPYGPCGSCTYSAPGGCNSVSCNEWNIDTGVYGEFLCCEATYTLYSRKCTFASDPNNPCGHAGPGGCAPCWNLPYDPGSDVCGALPAGSDCTYVICQC
jgi:hypothetical protein